MSVNYTANLSRSESDAVIHLGKSSMDNLSLSGVLFDSWADMKAFLLRNEPFGLTILAEHGVEYAAADFVAFVESFSMTARRANYDAAPADLSRHSDIPTPERQWLDAEGFVMSGYDFS